MVEPLEEHEKTCAMCQVMNNTPEKLKTLNEFNEFMQKQKEVKSGCDANDDGIPPNNNISVNTNI